MGREVKRVPIGFDWPLKTVWWGYVLDSVPCQTCDGSGKALQPITNGFQGADGTWHTYESEYCPTCEGEGKVCPKVELPSGPGYQLWETTSEGSPLSPVFTTPEELAHWLADNKASAFADMTLPYEKWLAFIAGPGWAPSAIYDGRKLVSGVEAFVEEAAAANQSL